MQCVVSLGYVCVCGERVTVFDLKLGESNQLPEIVTVACANGHTASFTREQVSCLELWTSEQTAAETRAASEDEREAA